MLICFILNFYLACNSVLHPSTPRTWSCPTTSSGAFKCLPRTREPSRPPGRSGKGGVPLNVPVLCPLEAENNQRLGCFSFWPSSCFSMWWWWWWWGATGLFTCITHCIIHVWWFYYSYYNLLMYYSLAKHVCCLLQKVEDTVENLESQLASLLQAIQDPKWRPLLDNVERTTVNVLEDPEWSENEQMSA